jgi:hypothetical protein
MIYDYCMMLNSLCSLVIHSDPFQTEHLPHRCGAFWPYTLAKILVTMSPLRSGAEQEQDVRRRVPVPGARHSSKADDYFHSVHWKFFAVSVAYAGTGQNALSPGHD